MILIYDVMYLINTVFTECNELFFEVFYESGMTELYIAIIFIVLAFKYILSPVLGRSQGSDKVRGEKNE